MNTDLAAQLVAAQTASTHHAAQIAMVKKAHEMEMNVVTMLEAAVKAPAPAGQGLAVDKQA
ncbi:hypothetical protein [Devosia nitrariae]|uniref:Motility protein n=1 Tax=Devosia nitrariae TaxID=2071872 RepID=A0ABQ5W2H1_9HYPH|nr:hypothetical protein [Devosia nitrariae]GLQ54192.1 hypothetical protein GCM10010862_14510 [Devosia nitrariae]